MVETWAYSDPACHINWIKSRVLIHNNKKGTEIAPLRAPKNLGRLWLAYTELQGDFCMLQFIFGDSRHFTQSEHSLGWSDLHEIKSVSFCISSLE